MNFLRRIKALSPREGYDLWARSYHAEVNPIKLMSDDFIIENMPDLNGRSVLDAGCGTGKFCELAVKRGAISVAGIDLSPAMITESKKNCPAATYVCSSLSDAIIDPQNYDVIICALVLAHIENHQPVLDNLIKGLKPNGTIIITDFHPFQTSLKAKRTFKDTLSGKTFEIKHTGHPIDHYLSAFNKNGITQIAFKEPRYSGNPVIFGIAGVKS